VFHPHLRCDLLEQPLRRDRRVHDDQQGRLDLRVVELVEQPARERRLAGPGVPTSTAKPLRSVAAYIRRTNASLCCWLL
jgi:hypothetical protein